MFLVTMYIFKIYCYYCCCCETNNLHRTYLLELLKEPEELPWCLEQLQLAVAMRSGGCCCLLVESSDFLITRSFANSCCLITPLSISSSLILNSPHIFHSIPGNIGFWYFYRTQWREIVLEKLIVAQTDKNFPAFYVTHRLNTMLTKSRHFALSAR